MKPSVNWTVVASITVPVLLFSMTWLIKAILGFGNEKSAVLKDILGVKTQVAVIETKVDTTQKAVEDVKSSTQASVQEIKSEFRLLDTRMVALVTDLKNEMRQYFKDERERVDRRFADANQRIVDTGRRGKEE